MIISFLYSILFFFTPLLFSSNNSEFFEIPKMYFVYTLTLAIAIAHLINVVKGAKPFFRHTIFSIPLLIFLSSQTISTIFSIDVHTSIFGYYSRMNGGLLSLISYTLLYLILTIYIDEKYKNRIINVSLFSGLIVALFGIAEHFGIDKNVWVQDVQTRVFSTLGQPNWLAAYLCILLPFALDKSLKTKKYFPLIIIFYICLLFTKSKSGIIASAISLGILGIIYFYKNINRRLLVLSFSLIIILSLTIPNPIKDTLFPMKNVSNGSMVNDSTINVTPSEDIRKIVWQGSLELWRQFPIFGTGPETFAYSYYWTRPASHNLTSEWNFLYNKAHNEYLNYMATTGTLGIVTYLILIIFICYVLFLKSPILFASYLSILITNSAGFSVVITSLYLFLLPVLILGPLITPTTKPSIYIRSLAIIFIIISTYLCTDVLRYYLADITYSQATTLDEKQDYQNAYSQIKLSLFYRSDEPIYLSKAADLLAKISLNQKDKEEVLQSISYIRQAIQISPFSLNLWKESAQTYYYLSTIDSKYYLLALDSLTKATKLAPTDAMSFYLLGQFYKNVDAFDKALENYQQALKLKPNYDYASFAIAKIYYDQSEFDKAVPMFEKTLQIAPSNLDAKNYLNIIATKSASLRGTK